MIRKPFDSWISHTGTLYERKAILVFSSRSSNLRPLRLGAGSWAQCYPVFREVVDDAEQPAASVDRPDCLLGVDSDLYAYVDWWDESVVHDRGQGQCGPSVYEVFPVL